MLLGNGNGTFQVASHYAAGSIPHSVAVGDFNGDAKPDLVVANFGSTNVSVLMGKGDGSFQMAVNYRAESSPSSVAVGDFNGDGRPDLAVADADLNAHLGFVSVLLGKGDGAFQSAVNYGAGSSPFYLVVGDFNSDEKPDLAVANEFSGNVSVLFGQGDGTFREAANYGVGSSPFCVAVGDFDGNGNPDLVVANYDANNLSVLLNTCASAFIELSIVRGVSTITLSWPFASTANVLESTTTLASPNWQPALEMRMTNNGRLEVTTPVDQGERYFRLPKP